MELPKITFDQLLVNRQYLIVCYRSGTPCTYQIYAGDVIGTQRQYFTDGEDANGNSLTYEFFQLPKTVR